MKRGRDTQNDDVAPKRKKNLQQKPPESENSFNLSQRLLPRTREFPYFPDELLDFILYHLDPAVLRIASCVSKLWNQMMNGILVRCRVALPVGESLVSGEWIPTSSVHGQSTRSLLEITETHLVVIDPVTNETKGRYAFTAGSHIADALAYLWFGAFSYLAPYGVFFDINSARMHAALAEGEFPEGLRQFLPRAPDRGFHALTSAIENLQTNGQTPHYDKSQLSKKVNALKLHPYQQQAVQWMKYQENKKGDSFNFLQTYAIPSNVLTSAKAIYRKVIYSTFDQSEFSLAPSYKGQHCPGGCLADDIGLGKTRSVVGLILSNKRKEHPKFEDQISFPCEAKGTLIIVNIGTGKQWEEEFKLAGKKPLVVTGWASLGSPIKKFLKSGVIIVCKEFFKNTYLDYRKRFQALHALDPEDEKIEYYMTDPAKTVPIFHMVKWHRLVLDEGHELDKFPDRDQIFQIDSFFRWYISATPVASGNQMIHLQKFLRVNQPSNPAKKISIFRNHPDLDFSSVSESWYDVSLPLLKNCVWRNIRQQTQGADTFELGEMNIEIKRLTFHIAESTLFHFLRFFSLPNHFTFNSMRDGVTLASYRNNIAKHYMLVKNIWIPLGKQPKSCTELTTAVHHLVTKTLKDKEYQLEGMALTHRSSSARMRFEVEKRNFNLAKEELEPFIQRLKRLMKKEKIPEEFTFPVHDKKAQFNRDLKSKEWQDHFVVPHGASDSDVVDKFGTKLGNLFLFTKEHLKKKKSASILIFSTCQQFLGILNLAFNKNNIGSRILQSSSQHREKSISLFKQKQIQILLCCSLGAAAGLNLQEASVVIIADSNHYREAGKAANEEEQIIGRAWRQGQLKDVQVYRFVVTGTSEDEALADITEKKQQMNSGKGKQLAWVQPGEDSFEDKSAELVETDDEVSEEEVQADGDSEDESMLEENEVEGLLSIDLTKTTARIPPKTTRRGTTFIDLT